MSPESLLAKAVAGERRWLARAITRLEERDFGVARALDSQTIRRRLGPGRPHVMGVTGPPGAGKSTLVDRWIAESRARQERVAVVAVDPSSPFSGGAILGDRVRMERHTADDGVYIRSLSSRGHLGGLSGATSKTVDLLDAVGYDRIIVETVGVGQSELGIMEIADTVVVVLTPESGDTVQTMKAGLLEIADVFVVNKADRPGAERLGRELELSVHLDERPWASPVLLASAIENRGIDTLDRTVREHLAWCEGPGRKHWEDRRGDARVRGYLDAVAERARARAASELNPEMEAQLRAGVLTQETLLEGL